MSSLRKLLSALALTLLVLTVESSSGGGGSPPNHSFDLSGSSLTRLYNSPVHHAERMKRPLEGTSSWVTLEDGRQYLVHKGDGYGRSSQTVVTDARHMSSAWERMKRPLEGTSSWFGPISHSGVRVTLEDGSKYLVHKGDGYGRSSQTVVTDARHMSSAWEPVSSRDFQGTKTVSDFVRAGGSNYNLFTDNCHLGSRRMMNQ
ncbi:hypothetical protein INR49_007976 [Caranx melampygus]|nr:hypothetical protein INR49_007976 [Caranx melampygus]